MARFRLLDQWLVDLAERKGVSCWEAIRAVALGTPIWTESMPTASVSVARGSTNILFHFNPNWFDSHFAPKDLDDVFAERRGLNFVAFVVLHELYHVILHHTDGSRCGDRNPMIWNWACDTVVNEFVLHKYGWEPFFDDAHKLDDNWTIDKVLPSTFKPFYEDPDFGKITSGRVNFTVEDVYEMILKTVDIEKVTILLVDVMNGGGAVSDGDGNPVPVPGAGSKPQQGKGDAPAKGKDDPEDVDAVFDKINSDPAASNSMAGMSDQFTEWAKLNPVRNVLPHVPWRKVFYDFVQTSMVVRSAESWARPSRKLYGFYPEMLLPCDQDDVTAKGQRVKVFLDVSSSMSKQLIQEFVALIHELPRNDAEFKYYLFNHMVHQIPEHQILSGHFQIGGGTSFHAIEQECIEDGDYPDIIIVLSDGECEIPEVLSPKSWCWVISSGGDSGWYNHGKNGFDGFGKHIQLPEL